MYKALLPNALMNAKMAHSPCDFFQVFWERLRVPAYTTPRLKFHATTFESSLACEAIDAEGILRKETDEVTRAMRFVASRRAVELLIRGDLCKLRESFSSRLAHLMTGCMRAAARETERQTALDKCP